MCGLVGYVGGFDPRLIKSLVYESEVRGLHNTGSHIVRGAGIYHTRYCTSGEDHQPIIRGNVALAMNGVIDMGTKKEMEVKYRVKLKTDNDAELLLLSLGEDSTGHQALQKFAHTSFAALVLTSHDLSAIRNDRRPLWVIEQGKKVLLASTQDIFIRSGAEWKKAKLLTPNKMYQWSIKNIM